jgi:mannose-6-phosphate isomerase-like protein (cupin superfamily)
MNKINKRIQTSQAFRAAGAKKQPARADAQWILDFEIKGRARQTALRRAGLVFKRWKLVMPNADPLTPHFGLHDFYRIGEIEYWIVNDLTNRYCGKFLFLFKNQRCPLHHHTAKDETFFIVRGRVRMTAGRRQFMMSPGDVFKMRPGVDHTFVAVGGPALILEVSLPSIQHDNIFADKAIGDRGII